MVENMMYKFQNLNYLKIRSKYCKFHWRYTNIYLPKYYKQKRLYRNIRLLPNIILILNYFFKRILRKGLDQKVIKFVNNFFLIFKYEMKLNLIPFFFVIVKYISPFLKFIRIKRKRRKEILKMKRLYPFAGLKLGLQWFSHYLYNKKTRNFKFLVDIFLIELIKVYFKTSDVYKRKFEEYLECSKSRFFK